MEKTAATTHNRRMKTILITGATSGFGKLIVQELLSQGHRVVATGRRLKDRNEILSHERNTFGEMLLELSLDVTDISEIQAARSEIQRRELKIDVLINNAGLGLFGSFEDSSIEQIRHQMEVNFFGVINVSKIFLPLIRESKGKIINFSSAFGFMGFPLTSVYCASKFAVEGLTESLRGELSPFGVQVCLVEPGGFNTGFGDATIWTTPSDPQYAKMQKNYHKMHADLRDSRPQNPKVVSAGVARLVNQKNVPLRKTFGTDAFMGLLTRTLLPRPLYVACMDLFYKFTFHKGL